MSVEEQNLEKLKYIFDNAKVGITICNAENNRLEMVNPAFAHIHGYEPHELIGTYSNEVFAPECMLRLNEFEHSLSCGINDIVFEATHIRKDGLPVYVSVHITVIKDESGSIKQRIVNLQDITERKQMEDEIKYNEARLKEAQKIAKIGSWEYLFPDLSLTFSDEMYRIFEIEQTVSHASYEEYINTIYPEDRKRLETIFDESVKNKVPYDIVHRLLMNDGRIKYVQERGKTIYDEDGNPIRSIGTVQDITEQKNIQKKIEHMAHHDALTGLPNLALAKMHTEKIIEKGKSLDNKVAILFIDLDGFKSINDSLGHSLGDLVLKMVASRLMEVTGINDILSRQGGDEFLLICSDIKDVGEVINISEKLLHVFEESFHVHNHFLSLSASVGISLYPDHGESFEVLLQSADTAMYKAKEQGKNGYCFYTQQMNHNMIGQFKLVNDLKTALKREEFILHYQPQIELSSKRIMGVEALIRWNHPQLGMISPMSFIPIAESSGQIVQIGQWVIEEACTQAALWHQNGIEISVAVNISAVQFRRGNLESVIIKALINSGLNPKFLELELTESIMMQDIESTLETVHNLKALGIQFSIDDFGTGYSSLAYLKRFAVDKLKIDQSFVRDIVQDQEDAAIVNTIIQMAKNLNLKTIAEGVEVKEVLDILERYGCDEVQGYYFAKPMDAKAFEEYVAQR
ncbi:MAG: EAL domain-containing protein [Sulfuricurvum sp.]|uniref:sensor domain-containing protein n=1 Tax=Sulfuricurvum sp. TaxID=2025608 RepID=UPI00260D5624|nr:GGDEF and EAL domain-containing protein [Sulfuricurvum sp.]MDD2830043.1 EAL domain-containing protein [Sulfuricurvum sp.]MDD4948364.1 EAL domain-containing protein [Sulfuricurvum sp.]